MRSMACMRKTPGVRASFLWVVGPRRNACGLVPYGHCLFPDCSGTRHLQIPAGYYLYPKSLSTMSPKTRNIIGWILAGLLGAFLLFSASGKFMDTEQMRQMIPALGLTPENIKLIGITEIFSVLMFLIPRTGVLGTLLLSAYLGGAMATHIEHPASGAPWAAVACMVVLWIAALLRFPELGWRISGKRAGA